MTIKESMKILIKGPNFCSELAKSTNVPPTIPYSVTTNSMGGSIIYSMPCTRH